MTLRTDTLARPPRRTTAAMLAAWFTASVFVIPSAYAEISITGEVNPLYDGSDPWNPGSNISVGIAADGTLVIDDASQITSTYGRVGDSSGVSGAVNIFGAGSKWTVTDTLYIGTYGTGLLTVENAGAVSSNYATLGAVVGSSGTVLVTGIDSRWDVYRELTIGERGTGDVRIESGGYLYTADLTIGGSSTGSGTLTVTGAGSHWHSRYDVRISGLGVQGVEIRDGGLFTSDDNVSILNKLVVADLGSRWDAAGRISVGGNIGGLLEIKNGGAVNSQGEADISGQSAQVVVEQAQWNHTGLLIVGGAINGTSMGTLHINTGGVVHVTGNTLINERNSDDSIIQFNGGTLNTDGLFATTDELRGIGTIITRGMVSDLDLVFDAGNALSHQISLAPITGENVTINFDTQSIGNPGAMGAAYEGIGSLTVQDGRVISSGEGYLGYRDTAIGTATITGPGSQWNMTGDLFVGRFGQGTLLISNGAVVSNDEAEVAVEAGSNGTVTVSGTGSKWINTRNIFLGDEGSAELTIENGAMVSGFSVLAGNLSSTEITVRGIGSQFSMAEDFKLGLRSTGTLTIEDGAIVYTGDQATIADAYGAQGTATVTGSGSQWDIGRQLEIARANNTIGTLEIVSGGLVTSEYVTIGNSGTSNGSIVINGPGSRLDNEIDLYVGYFNGRGSITVENGGTLQSGSDVMLADLEYANGTITVTGPGSTFHHERRLYVGDNGTGTLNITSGGVVTGSHGYIAYDNKAVGTTTMDGGGSQWTIDRYLEVGREGNATLNILNGGTVNSGVADDRSQFSLNRGFYPSAWIGYNSSSAGTVTVDGSGSQWNNTQDLFIGYDGTATLNINQGGLVQSGGITVVDYWTNKGTIQFNGGTLTTGGLLAPSSKLQGTGTINTYSLVADYDMVFDATTGPQQQITLSSLPGQNITINYDNVQPEFVRNDAYIGAGYHGAGSLTIEDGVVINTVTGYLGYNAGSNGSATVTDAGSQWNNTGGLYVGRTAIGTLNIQSGGRVTNAYGYIAYDPGSAGSATVDGPGSQWINANTLFVGRQGPGTLSINNGGVVTSAAGYIGYLAGSTGTATVDGSGSQWNNANTLYLGIGGIGTLRIQNGGAVNNGGVTRIAYLLDPQSQTPVEGGSIQFNNGTLTTGGLYASNSALQGTGTINTHSLIGDYTMVFDPTTGTRQQITLDALPGQNITINYDNIQPDFVTNESFIGAGYTSVGSMTIASGVTINTAFGHLGYRAGSDGTATVADAGSQWNIARNLYVGDSGIGSLNILNGGQIFSASGLIGNNSGSTGTATIDGTGSKWNNTNYLFVGNYGTANLQIQNGGGVTTANGYIAYASGSIGTATVDGNGSQWSIAGELLVGYQGTGTLRIQNGGEVNSAYASIARLSGSNSTVTVDGAGSRWNNTNALYVGNTGNGTLNIQNGGVVSTAAGYLGYNKNSTGTATVDGTGSTWNSAGDLFVGNIGTGTLNIQNGGSVNANGITNIIKGSVQFINGTLTTGGLLASNSQLLGMGTINAYSLIGDYDLVFNPTTGTQQQITLNALTDQNITINYDNIQPAFVVNESFLGAGYVGVGSIVIEGATAINTNTGHLGEKAGSFGTATVTGAGSQWNNTGDLLVGNRGNANLKVQNGGVVNAGLSYIGYYATSTSMVTVEDNGSQWNNANDLYIGYHGSGTLNIQNGGAVNTDGITHIREKSGAGLIQFSNGTLTTGGLLAPNDALLGTGTINTYSLVADYDLVFNPTTGTQQQITLNALVHQNITINYDNIQPAFATNESFLGAGYVGVGSLVIEGGTALSTTNGYLGYKAGSTGTATLTDADSQWNNMGNLFVGYNGTGSLNIQNGGQANSAFGWIGNNSGSIGTTTVDGSGSQWDNAENLTVGYNGTGTLNIQNGGVVNTAGGYIGTNSAGNGTVTVDGAGSQWNNTGNLFVGNSGRAVLKIQNDGEVNTNGITTVAFQPSKRSIQFNNGTLTTGGLLASNLSLLGTGTINAYSLIGDYDLAFNPTTGTQQQITLNDLPDQNITINYNNVQPDFVTTESFLGVGYARTGSMVIEGGVVITTADGYLGYESGADGTATITDAGSQWNNTGALYVGRSGDGKLNVQNGGVVSSGFGYIGSFAGSKYQSATAAVDGAGSQWNIAAELFVGYGGIGTLEILNGGLVSSDLSHIGYLNDSTGSATIDGSGSQWNVTNNLFVGYQGEGTLHIKNNAVVRVAENTTISGADGTGTLNFEHGTLNTKGLLASLDALQGTGTINTNTIVSDLDLTFNAATGLQPQQFTLNAAPGQNITLNIDPSEAANNGKMGAGFAGTASLTIEGGVQLGSTNGYLGYKAGSDGTATVTGQGSRWDNTSSLSVGSAGQGTLNIAEGAVVRADTAFFAQFSQSAASVTVDGSGSRFETGYLEIGIPGKGMLTILNDGAVRVDGDLTLGNNAELQLGLVSAAYPLIEVGGNANLAGLISVNVAPELALAYGDEFTLISIGGTQLGSFSKLEEGDLLGNYGMFDLYFTYAGGDGNDVVAYVPNVGDLNGDRQVDQIDLDVLLNGWGTSVSAASAGDWSADGFVGIDDLAATLRNWTGTSAPVINIPEPGSALVLMILAAGLSRRRRH